MFRAIMMNINEVQQPLRWIIILYASLNTARIAFFLHADEGGREIERSRFKWLPFTTRIL